MPDYFVHPSSYIDPNVSIGSGTKIWFFCHIQSGAVIGENCSFGQNVNVAANVKIGNGVKVQNNVSIYEGVELQDYVFCGPSMVFTNDLTPRAKYPKGSAGYKRTLVKEGASIGANATVVCGHTIGRWALIRLGRGGDPRRPRPRADARRARPSGRLGLRVRPDSGQDPPLPRLRTQLPRGGYGAVGER